MKNRKWLKVLLVILAVVIMGVVFSCQSEPADPGERVIYDENDTTAFPGTEADEDNDPEEMIPEDPVTTAAAAVCVHVCGCVKTPGVYFLENGSRIIDAVESAGGLTEEAAQDFVNLAKQIEDGERIYIPSVSETENVTVDLTENTGHSGASVNINTADAAELMTLPGIGEAKAEAIISYRKKTGKFNSTDELINVSGIGEALYDQIKDKIKV